MNWKLRIMNRATLAAIAAAVVGCVYQILGIVGIVPTISEDSLVTALGLVLNVLVAVGVLVDPTTAGIGDSERAMGYDKPYSDSERKDPSLFVDEDVMQ